MVIEVISASRNFKKINLARHKVSNIIIKNAIILHNKVVLFFVNALLN